MATFRLWLCTLLLILLSGPSLAQPDFSFSTAKKHLERSIYKEVSERTSFYCGCSYSDEKQVDAASCGYEPRKNAKRGSRIEWEHIVPASRFGKDRVCWSEGHEACVTSKGKTYKGRRCCGKVDDEFRAMEADLHNLVPAVGELNGDRSNFRISSLEGEPRAYGACDFEIDFTAKVMEPQEGIRGDIARAYLYMNATYNMPLTDEERDMYLNWNEMDPPSDWELERNQRILFIQNNANPLIAPAS
ncbi:endonuclease [Pseudovibrio exalbescens]|uniref:endonuclease n=1 Tax=Pseudovibrio exalbescens TaxID=197461 RepID=UPI0023661F14|nr:endonuclease [Pseudovibrio exalbescens]MDD7909757.1 endonuclease [Pseudovibrio exalbescens]